VSQDAGLLNPGLPDTEPPNARLLDAKLPNAESQDAGFLGAGLSDTGSPNA
jgi:hypothetical protein